MKISVDSIDILEVSESNKNVLLNDLADINEWIVNAITGKIENCYERFKKYWIPILMNDPNVTNIPANRDDFISMVMARSDYKNRAQRDAEAADGTNT